MCGKAYIKKLSSLELMKVPFFVPWINNDDKKAVLKTLDQRWLTNGPNLKKFEENFHNFIGTKYSIV